MSFEIGIYNLGSAARIAPPQFVSNGLARIPGGTAFIYLFRRYGYPNYYGSKSVAGYEIKTPMADVFVDFAIKNLTCWIYATAARELYRRYVAEEVCLPSDFCQRVDAAVRDCLLDQLRPVAVGGGEYINILGAADFEYDEDADRMVGEVAYFELDRHGNGESA